MRHDIDYHCKIYVTGTRSQLELLEVVSAAVGEKIVNGDIESPLMEIYLGLNDERDESRPFDIGDNFLYSVFLLDIESKSEAEPQVYVQKVGEILERLWRHGVSAVASCDFEDLLPRRGGYNYEDR